MKVILAIDTSGDHAHCALRTADGTIIESSSSDTISHNEELAVMIDALIKKSAIEFSDLCGIVIGAGPGSFTGLRIGFSVVKGMAYALRVAVVTVPSHLGIALGSELRGATIAVLSDARRDQFFCSVYRISEQGDIAATLLATQLLARGELHSLRKLAKIEATKLMLIAPEACVNLIPDVERRDEKGIARGLLSAVNLQSFQDFKIEDLANVEPNYIRDVAAKTIAQRKNETRGLVETSDSVLTQK